MSVTNNTEAAVLSRFKPLTRAGHHVELLAVRADRIIGCIMPNALPMAWRTDTGACLSKFAPYEQRDCKSLDLVPVVREVELTVYMYLDELGEPHLSEYPTHSDRQPVGSARIKITEGVFAEPTP